MAYVLIGTGAFGAGVIFILIIFEKSDDIINRMRPGIIGVKAETLRQIAFEIDLHRVVIRLRIAADSENIAETRSKRTHAGDVGAIDVALLQRSVPMVHPVQD